MRKEAVERGGCFTLGDIKLSIDLSWSPPGFGALFAGVEDVVAMAFIVFDLVWFGLVSFDLNGAVLEPFGK